jgi:hypothetical protein
MCAGLQRAVSIDAVLLIIIQFGLRLYGCNL